MYVLPVRQDSITLKDGSERKISSYNSYTGLKSFPAVYLDNPGKYELVKLSDIVAIDSHKVVYDEYSNMLISESSIDRVFPLPQIKDKVKLVTGEEKEVLKLQLFFHDVNNGNVLKVKFKDDDSWTDFDQIDFPNRVNYLNCYREYIRD